MPQRRWMALLTTVLVIQLATPWVAPADTMTPTDRPVAAKSETLTLYWENDGFAGTDRDYTNGFRLTWSSAFNRPAAGGQARQDSAAAGWLPFARTDPAPRAISLSLGQEIYTPEDTFARERIDRDRPYAGYAYLAAGDHRRRDRHKDSWEIRLGVVGPASLAEEVQHLSHDLIAKERARGWDNQLNNEVVCDLIYQRRWRLWSAALGSVLDADLIPHAGLHLGTVRTGANLGAEVRFGWNLARDFGSCPIRGGCETNSAFADDSTNGPTLHLFIATDGQAVARDIFLDGNTFSDSHRVDKEILVGEFMAGVAWQTTRTKITYSYIHRTRQFSSQGDNQNYGSISLGLRF